MTRSYALVILILTCISYSLSQDESDIIPERIKRNSVCTSTCANKYSKRVQESKIFQKQAQTVKKYPFATCRWFTVEQVTEMCDAKNETKQCLDACPNSGAKKKIQAVLAETNFICDDRFENFTQYYPCISKNCKTIDQACASKCKPYRGDAAKLFNTEGNKKLNIANLTNYADDACGYMACYTNCSHFLTNDTCGPEAADMETEISQRTVTTYLRLLTPIEGFSIPSNCTAFLEGTPSAAVEKFSANQTATKVPGAKDAPATTTGPAATTSASSTSSKAGILIGCFVVILTFGKGVFI